jgi:alpha-N-arabinofuranosidase
VLFASHLGTEVVASALTDAGPRMYASVTRDDKLRKLFVKVVNASSETEPVTIALTGVEKVQPEAKLVTLSGKTPNATNTIANPEAIVPVEYGITVNGPKFEQSFAPYSINVLEISY